MKKEENLRNEVRKVHISTTGGGALDARRENGFRGIHQMPASPFAGTVLSGLTFDSITEAAYLIVLGLCLLKSSFETTLFYLPWPPNYEAIVFIMACGVVMLRVGYVKRYGGLYCLFCAVMGIVYKLSWQQTEYNYLFLLYIPVLIIGAMGIDYKKILKVSFVINLATLAVAFLGSCFGVVRDLVYEIDSSHRHSFGIMYTTDFAARIFYLLLVGWVLYENVHIIVNLSVVIFSAWFIFRFCQAKCGEIILVLLALCILYEYTTRKGKLRSWLPARIIDHLCVWCAPICAVGIILLSLFYEEKVSWMCGLDGILTQRLSLSHKAMNQYGFTLFGTAFAQEGNGGTTAYNFFYNFIDSSYVLILLRYGTLVFIMFMTLYIYQGRIALREGRRRLLLAGALVAVHSAIEHHMPEVNYNIFIVLPLASFHALPGKREEVPMKKEWGRRWKTILAAVPGIALLLLIAPSGVGYIRTVVYLLEYYHYVNGIYFVLWCLVIAIAVYVFLYHIRKMLLCHGRKDMLRNVAGILLSAAVVLTIFAVSKGVLRDKWAEYSATILNEKKILEEIFESGGEEIS